MALWAKTNRLSLILAMS